MPFPTSQAIGQRMLSAAGQTIPNSAADLTTKNCWLFQLVLCNKTGGAVTVTIQDKQATPIDVITGVSIAANTTYVLDFPEGLFMSGGINWVASAATSITAFINAYVVE